MKKLNQHFALWALLLLPLIAQAGALSCKHFEYESLDEERNAVLKKYENRDFEKLSDKERDKVNQTNMLNSKTVCTVSGSLNEAFAIWRKDKKWGLGDSSAKFTQTLPAKNYKKKLNFKAYTATWEIKRKGNQVVLEEAYEGEGYIGTTTTFTPNGNTVRIESRTYSP